jgi:hypothetical protein
MPLTGTQADNNVPQLAGRARYNILGMNPTWVYHEMATGATAAGEAPRSAAKTEAEIDPTVKAGRARWTDLTKGGLFTMLAHAKQPIIVEAIDNAGSATLTIVDSQGNQLRTVPNTLPFKVAPGECLKASGGASGGKVGFLVRIDAQRVL